MMAIRATGVAKRFRRNWVVEGVDLEISAGECLAVLGHNGSGKTTLLRMLAGAVPPDSGTLEVVGHDARTQPGLVRSVVGVDMGEDRSWYWRLSGRANLEFFAALHGVGPGAARRVEELMGLVGLSEVRARRVGEYSSGMRARLGIARALLTRAPVLILDEPTRSVDPAGAADIAQVLGRLCSEHGTTVVLATHSFDQAAELADQMIVLEAGRVVARPPQGSSADSLSSLVGSAPT